MNQPESEFEKELRKVCPASPAPSLEERVAKEFATAPSTLARGVATRGRLDSKRSEAHPLRFWLSRLSWAAVGALAMFAALSLRDRPEPPADASSVPSPTAQLSPADALKHVESRSELLEAEDEGLFYASETSEPVRQMRYRFLELHAWRDAETGALVEVEVPREDVRYMPVAMQ